MAHVIRTFVLRLFVDETHPRLLRGALDEAETGQHHTFRSLSELISVLAAILEQTASSASSGVASTTVRESRPKRSKDG